MMEAPRPAALPSGGPAAEARWRKLQEYLAAKGKRRRPSTKPYLKDKTNRQNLSPSRPEPMVRCQIPSMSRSAQIRKAKWTVPADQIFPGNRSAPPVPSKPPAKNHSEKLSSTVSSTKCHSCRLRKSEKWELVTAPRTVNGLANCRCQLKNCQEKVGRDKKNAGAKIDPQFQKRAVSRLGLKANSQVISKHSPKKSRQTMGSSISQKSQVWTDQTAEQQVQGKPREPADFKQSSSPQKQVHSNSVVLPPSQLGQFSAVSRPVVKSQGQLPRTIKQSMVNLQAAGVLAQGEPLTGRENTIPSIYTALNVLRREQSRQQANSCQALHKRRHPNNSVKLRRELKLTPGGICSATRSVIDQNRSTAERNRRGKTPKQMPRTISSESRHTASPHSTANVAVDSLKRGRGTPKSRQPAMGAGQAPKTPCLQDRRELLEQWLASRGKCYKRPPMTLPAQRPQKEKEGLNLSFWNCMEEEEAEESEQLRLTDKITSTLTECLKLAEEGFSSEKLLAMLSRIPEAEKFAQFWICKAQLLARQGTFDVMGLYEAAVRAGAVPLQQLRDVIVDILKNASKTAQAIPAEASPSSAEEQAETSPQSPVPGSACKPLSAIKLQVVPLLRAKELSMRPDMKLLTPVRRSLRIEHAAACYPQMLKDHDPVVSSLDEIMDNKSQFIFRNNDALPEDVEMAEFVTVPHSLGQNATQQP